MPILDTSPLVHQARMDACRLMLSVWHHQGANILTTSVYREAVLDRPEKPGAREIVALTKQGHFEVRPVFAARANPALRDLGEGEADAIALALANRDRLLIIEDGPGRIIAMRLGLRITGNLGVLARAKALGLISTTRPLVEKLLEEGARYSAKVLRAHFAAMSE